MKIAGLVIGILLMVVSGIAFIICLLLPSMTGNKVNFEESLLGLIPAAFFSFVGFVVTVVSGIFLFRGKKKVQEPAM